MEVMFTIFPCFWSIMCSATAWMQKNIPFRLVSSTWSQASSDISSRLALAVTPALFTRMSMRPNSRITCATM